MSSLNSITLVLGASPQADRYSHQAVLLLKQCGYEVLALGNRAGTIGDMPIYTNWEALPSTTIDTITLYIGAERQADYYNYILSTRPRRIIFNPGAENPTLERLARATGIQTLDACTLVMLRTNQY